MPLLTEGDYTFKIMFGSEAVNSNQAHVLKVLRLANNLSEKNDNFSKFCKFLQIDQKQNSFQRIFLFTSK